jgi:hypothetical protein
VISIDVRTEAVRAAALQAPQAVRRARDRWAPRAAAYTATEMARQILMRQKTEGRTGYLRKSIRSDLFQGGFTTYPAAAYAGFVDQPTQPHVIEPRNRQALAFARSGGVLSRSLTGNVRTRMLFGGRQATTSAVIVRRVHHPGTRGMFFIDATARVVLPSVADMLEREVQEEMRRSGW